ncbi:hypothetical protein AUP68_17122 [Ilyonectria robusta]
MASFTPIPTSLIDLPSRLPRRLPPEEPDRQVRVYLKLLSRLSSFHDRPYSWGYTIFRTVYTPESDETFPKAIESLKLWANRFVMRELEVKRLPNEAPLDPAPNEELARRFYCDIVQDASTLDGAGVEEVGKRFDAWVNEHLQPEAHKRMVMGRYSFCIMLDQQGIDHLPQMRDNLTPHKAFRAQLRLHVKLLTDWQRDPEEGGRFWIRVGIQDQLFPLCFGLGDSDISELGLPDQTDGVHNFYGMFPFHPELD